MVSSLLSITLKICFTIKNKHFEIDGKKVLFNKLKSEAQEIRQLKIENIQLPHIKYYKI